MNAVHRFVASSPRGFGDLLAAELRALGAADVRERALGVEFSGALTVAYRACLESRVASRVFLVVAQFEAPTDAAFYDAVRAVDWRAHIDPARTLACDFSGKHPEITHTKFGALRLKDGICDQLREVTGSRPDIAPDRPSVRVHAHANGPKVTVSIDLSGEGLHRRGYRAQAGEAPLRENLAAGILLAGEIQNSGGIFRSDVRLGHAGHRGCDDRRECRAGRAPSVLRIFWLGRFRSRRLGEREERRARARSETGDAYPRHGCGCGHLAGGARKRRARRARRTDQLRAR